MTSIDILIINSTNAVASVFDSLNKISKNINPGEGQEILVSSSALPLNINSLSGNSVVTTSITPSVPILLDINADGNVIDIYTLSDTTNQCNNNGYVYVDIYNFTSYPATTNDPITPINIPVKSKVSGSVKCGDVINLNVNGQTKPLTIGNINFNKILIIESEDTQGLLGLLTSNISIPVGSKNFNVTSTQRDLSQPNGSSWWVWLLIIFLLIIIILFAMKYRKQN